MAKKKILVSGAGGLVGSHLQDCLVDEYEIFALVRTIPENVNKKIIYHETNLVDDSMLTCLPNKMDAIVHLAQSNHFKAFPSKAIDIFNINVRYTALLLDYAAKVGVKHFIYTSTGGIYGGSQDPIEEDCPIKISAGELAYYFRSKYASENLVWSYIDYMTISILRPFFIYGSKQKKSMLLPRLVDSIKEGNPISLEGEEGVSINPIHVKDVVNLIKKRLVSKADANVVINVAGSEILSIRKICEIIGSELGRAPIFKHVVGNTGNIVAKNDVMRSILNCELTSFLTGITNLL